MKKKKMRHDFSATVLMVKTLLKAFKALTQIHACAHTHPCICECAQKLNALRGKQMLEATVDMELSATGDTTCDVTSSLSG